ncbi:hypothetical protein [Pseudomonas lactis]|uniref:hypothetical protein n=1 Tax=Pseudomonas lactis TaxID=1615674 RepID=UPI00321B08A9
MYAQVTPEGIPDSVDWAEGMPYLIRNGRAAYSYVADEELSSESTVMVSAAAVDKAELNRELCAPGDFHPMPSIAYRLARVAAGDGICGISLYAVSAHEVVAGHALLRGAGGVFLDENGADIRYVTDAEMRTVSQRCFGGSPSACRELLTHDWDRIITDL